MGKIVNVAVVGYGGMGGWHTRLLQEIPEVGLVSMTFCLNGTRPPKRRELRPMRAWKPCWRIRKLMWSP